MAFKLQEFIASINNDGVAKTHYFEVSITTPTGLSALTTDAQRLLTLRCQDVQLPEVDFQVLPYYSKVIGPGESRVMGMSPYKVVPMNFIVDAELKVRKFFENWMQYIVNYGDYSTYSSIGNNQLPYEMAYKKEYVATIEIKVYPHGLSADATSNDNSPAKIYRLLNAYPVNMGNVSLGWGGGDSNMILPVGFNYDRIEMPSMLNYLALGDQSDRR